eukprot:gene12425-15624_t
MAPKVDSKVTSKVAGKVAGKRPRTEAESSLVSRWRKDKMELTHLHEDQLYDFKEKQAEEVTALETRIEAERKNVVAEAEQLESGTCGSCQETVQSSSCFVCKGCASLTCNAHAGDMTKCTECSKENWNASTVIVSTTITRTATVGKMSWLVLSYGSATLRYRSATMRSAKV